MIKIAQIILCSLFLCIIPTACNQTDNPSFNYSPFIGSEWINLETALSKFDLDSSKSVLQSIKPTNSDEKNYINYRTNEIAKWEADLTGPVLDSIIELDSLSPPFQQLLFCLNKHLIYQYKDPLLLENIVNDLKQDSALPFYWIAKGYQAIGDIYHLHYNNINETKFWYESALNLYQKLPTPVPEILFLYKDMIQISVATREYQLGQLYGQKMIDIATTKYKENPDLQAIAFYLSGYMDLISGDSSTVKFNQALSFVEGSNQNRLIQQIALYANYSYRFPNQNERAQPFLELLSTNIAINGDYIDYEKVVGEKYYVDEIYKIAIIHLLKALEFSSSHPALYPGHRLSILYTLILSYIKLKQYDKALDYAFMSLSGNDTVDPTLSRKAIIDTILSGIFDPFSYSFIDVNLIAKTFLLSYQQSKSLSDLYLALDLVKKAFSLVENEEYSIEEFRRLELTKFAKVVFETGMHICAELYSQTGQDSILNDYFLFASNNKYRILTGESSILYQQYQIPEIIASKERGYKAKYNKFRRLQKSDSLYFYKVRIDSLNDLYLSMYPNFYHARLSLSRPNLSKLKIPINTTLLDYQLFDSTLFLLQLRKNKQQLFRQKLSPEDYKLLDQIIAEQRDPSPNLDSLWKHALSGTNLLLPEIKQNGDSYLVISPCKIVSRISFAALTLSESPDYLDDRFHIFYMNRIHSIDDLPSTIIPSIDQKIAAFAFSDKNTIKSSNLSIELPGSYLEVQALKNQHPNTIIYSGLQANKANLFKTLQDTSVDHLHIAMHAYADAEGNIDPYLLFRDPQDVNKLDTLFCYELLNHPTQILSITLTSCLTREGKYLEGEGIYDISRFFFQIGANTITTSLWAISDFTRTQFKTSPYYWAYEIPIIS
ncbi:MAG: CHAT domain-containing protein [Saprospiraceae bacterium]|nr:CHAT domain-containing protein [Saprospiraceae bacterium]HPG07555.1 CHAT domain-containing protein [Saprospiraceae bacterium]